MLPDLESGILTIKVEVSVKPRLTDGSGEDSESKAEGVSTQTDKHN